MRIPILAYHAVLPVADTERWHETVPLGVFTEQVDWLARHGYTALSLDAAADLIEGRGPRVRRPIVLTFDDGYRCSFEHALPVLEQAGFSATLFIVTGAVGKNSGYAVDVGGPRFEHAGWDEIEDAARRGFEVGSHTVTHRRMTELEPDECDEELGASRDQIASRLGRCAHFAYPYGAATEATAARVARHGYRTACTTEEGLNERGQPLPMLMRHTIGRRSGIGRFRLVRFRRKLGRLC